MRGLVHGAAREPEVKRALVFASLLVAGTAWADAPLIVPPAGWHRDAAQATAAATKANGVSHFGGATSMATADVQVPEKPGVVMFVTAVAAKIETNRELAARVEVDELHATSQRAQLAGSGISEDQWAEAADPAAKQITAELSWRDAGAHTQTSARMIIVGDAANLVALTGECVAADDAAPADLAACKASLATLNPGIPADKRVALTLAPAGSRPAPKDNGPSTMNAIGDGTHTPLPPMTVTPREKPAPDRRPVYVGLGIVLLAAVFYWNSRRRAKFEKDSDE